MKLIALVPVRNEERILQTTLSCLEKNCDHIIVSDHFSSDRTCEIATSFPKVSLIHNHTSVKGAEHGRPALFEAAREFQGENILLCIDADEIVPPLIYSNLKKYISENHRPGTVFSPWWVQLWKSFSCYINDQSIWSNLYKPMIFYDDRSAMKWDNRHFLHGGRLPGLVNAAEPVKLAEFPILHLQWGYWNRTQIKQSHYRILEFIHKDFKDAVKINYDYRLTLGHENELTNPINERWMSDVELPANLTDIKPCWHFEDVMHLFDRYGIECFEPLEIWHVQEFRDLFINEYGREPESTVSNFYLPARASLKRIIPNKILKLSRDN